MISADDTMRRCWNEIAGPEFEHTAELLVARHAEPHRRYHTAVHVRWVLHHLNVILTGTPTGDRAEIDVDAVRAAALFHDVVYDPRSITNESDSANIARRAMAEVGWSGERLQRVHDLVLATAGHQTNTIAAAVLVDADLAVLGADPADYCRYVEGVRFEYDFVDDAAWRSGRAAVLQSFLDRDHIFSTAPMAGREQQARHNLDDELASLVSAESR